METKHTPLVSAIIPTYNRSALICEAIDSVLAQTYKNIEVIVVDDGSTDDTAAKVAAYNGKVQYIRQENAGPSAARNTGIEQAKGELIALLDSDDLWLPDRLEREVPEFVNDPEVGMVYAGAAFFNNTTKVTTSEYLPPAVDLHGVLSFCSLPIQTLLLSRSVIRKAGLYDTTLPAAEDWEFCIRMAACCKVRRVPAILAKVRHHGGETQGGDGERVFRCSMRVVEMHKAIHGNCPECRKALRHARAELRENYYGGLKAHARSAFAKRNLMEAARYCFRAFWNNPAALSRILRRKAVKLSGSGLQWNDPEQLRQPEGRQPEMQS